MIDQNIGHPQTQHRHQDIGIQQRLRHRRTKATHQAALFEGDDVLDLGSQGQNKLAIEGLHKAGVDNCHIQPMLWKQLRRLQGRVNHRTVGQQQDIITMT